MSDVTYAIRLRVRLGRSLTSDKNLEVFCVEGKEVKVSSLDQGHLTGSEWVSLSAGGFSSEAEARTFGERFQDACAIAAVSCMIGIDVGVDRATSAFSETLKEQIKAASGVIMRDNIHGLDVFVEDPAVGFVHISSTGSGSANPHSFFAAIKDFFPRQDRLSEEVTNTIILLNYALMRRDPVATAVFAISSVEAIGQRGSWSQNQHAMLGNLIKSVDCSNLSLEEKSSLIAALERLAPKSLAKGVSDLLDSLDLKHLKQAWNEMYRERSTLVHGLSPKPGVDYREFAFRCINLSVHIMACFVDREIPGFSRNLMRHSLNP